MADNLFEKMVVTGVVAIGANNTTVLMIHRKQDQNQVLIKGSQYRTSPGLDIRRLTYERSISTTVGEGRAQRQNLMRTVGTQLGIA